MISTKQYDPYDEGTLLKIASAGSLEAFNRLVLAYGNIAYHHAYAILGDAMLAEDVTSEMLHQVRNRQLCLYRLA